MNRYEKMGYIGRGSYGKAFIYLRLADKQQVVIKHVAVQSMDPEVQQAANNEVKVLQLLNHPNIIRYYDSFLESYELHIVMDYASGGSLHGHLRARNGRLLPYKEVMSLFCQMVEGLEYIHLKSILHRDFNTSNIFLKLMGQQLVVKIGDFGISKILETQSKALTQLGTQSHWSPEICEDKPYNEASDIWALGCVLYEMLTLKRPFEAKSVVAIGLKVLRGEYAPFDSQTYPDKALPALLRSLLTVVPELRITTPGIRAHPAVIPHIHRLTVDLGRIQ